MKKNAFVMVKGQTRAIDVKIKIFFFSQF